MTLLKTSELMSEKSSYSQILKSSSIMGGAAGIKMCAGLLQTKFAALLIGTSGVGLLASFTIIQGLIGTIAGMGIQSSAVREVAAAVGKGDEQAICRAVLTLRRICWLTGLAGLLGMALIAPLISQLTFGSKDYTFDIAALGLVVLMANISGGQMALIQGMRRIGDLAKAQMISAALGVIAAIGFYYWLGVRGVMPSMVMIAFITLLTSWRFARRVQLLKVELSWKQTFTEAGGMIKLGLSLMLSNLINSLLLYFIVTLINENLDVNALGIYSAAYFISVGIMSFVFSAMSADYYPRLVNSIDCRRKSVDLVNEQMEVGALLALPVLIGIYLFSDQAINILYSKEFADASSLIRVFILGMFARVIAWPMGFVVLAAGKKTLFFFLELFFISLQAGFIILLFPIFGLHAISAAFTLIAILNIAVEIFISRKIIGFKFSRYSRRIIFFGVLMCAVTVCLEIYIESSASYYLGFILLAYTSVVSISNISARVQRTSKMERIRIMLVRLKLNKTTPLFYR